MQTITIFFTFFLVCVGVGLNFAQEAPPSRRPRPLLSFADNDIDSTNDAFYGGPQQLLAPSWMSARDTDGYPSLFEMPMRAPSFFMPPIRPNPYIERMIESMNKRGEMMRKQLEQMPATHETNEQVISLGGRKFVKQCKTTKRGSGSTIMMEQVCKLVPQKEESQIEPTNNQVVPPSDQPKQQPNNTADADKQNGSQNNSEPSNGRDSAASDELKHKQMDDDSGETMIVPTN